MPRDMPRAAQHSIHPSSSKHRIWAPVSEGSGKSKLLFFYSASFSPWPNLGSRERKFIGRLAWPNGQGEVGLSTVTKPVEEIWEIP